MSWGSLDIARKQERNKAVVISAILFIAFLLVTEQVMTKSFIYRLDHKIEALKHHTFRGLSSHFLLALDDLGLRSLTATCLLLTAAVIAYRFRSWRPINLSVAALLLLNGVVGLSKLIFGRTKPRLNMDYLHQGGLSYPSGHASNALLTWGMLAYLVHTYTNRKPFKGIRLYWLVGVITATVCVVSLIRKTHWFSDLLGGLFLGGSLLIFLVALDRAWPSKKQPE